MKITNVSVSFVGINLILRRIIFVLSKTGMQLLAFMDSVLRVNQYSLLSVQLAKQCGDCTFSNEAVFFSLLNHTFSSASDSHLQSLEKKIIRFP